MAALMVCGAQAQGPAELTFGNSRPCPPLLRCCGEGILGRVSAPSGLQMWPHPTDHSQSSSCLDPSSAVPLPELTQLPLTASHACLKIIELQNGLGSKGP